MENYSKLLNQIEALDKEPFDNYKMRVKNILPNWPELALKTWLHRHSPCMYYAWLGFHRMNFRLETWSKDQVFNNISSHRIEDIDYYGNKIVNNIDNWFDAKSCPKDYICENKTWNEPIIVLDNSYGIEKYGDKFGQPYHLLEGHVRLGVFRELFKQDKSKLLDQHDLFIVTIDDKDVAHALANDDY